MIFGNIKTLLEYPFLEEQIKKCFTYAADNDLLSFEKGSHEIDGDRLPIDGEKNSSVVLRPGDYLICYPSDGHRTAVAVEAPETIKKAIFKVCIE